MAIKTATNFEILDAMPIDTRFVVNTADDLALIKAYEGLDVYVKSTAIKMRYDGANWNAILNVTKTSELVNDSGFVTELTLSNYYTKEEADQQIADTVLSLDLSNYATKEEVKTAVASLDLSNYYTKEEVDVKIANVSSGGTIDLTNYYTKDETTSLIDTKVKLSMPRRLKDDTSISLLSNTANRQEIYLFADNNGVDAKISVSELLDKKIRTVSEEPSDLQVGEYIFLQI